MAFSAILDLLGWEHAKEGDKAANFSSVFDLLGVTFDLSAIQRQTLTITNKASRIDKLCKMLEDVEAARTITAARASEIQGLLNFAVSFYMGRGLKHLVSAFMPYAEGQQCKAPDELVNLCSYA